MQRNLGSYIKQFKIITQINSMHCTYYFEEIELVSKFNLSFKFLYKNN